MPYIKLILRKVMEVAWKSKHMANITIHFQITLYKLVIGLFNIPLSAIDIKIRFKSH